MYKIIPFLLLLTGCFEAELGIDPVDINYPDLPCYDGWLYDHFGNPVLNPYGAQVTCE